MARHRPPSNVCIPTEWRAASSRSTPGFFATKDKRMDLHKTPLANEFFEHVAVTSATAVAFLEGPAVAADGVVYFSDILNNRIMKFDPRKNERSVWRTPSGRTNGLLFDAQGRLLARSELLSRFSVTSFICLILL